MTVFNAEAATDYDQRIIRLVPGYALAQSIAAAILADLLPAGAHILIAGCGTGGDLMALADANPSWRFSAVEPSAAMLAAAESKVAAAGAADRVSFHNSRLHDAPLTLHDAAVSFLVCHFIPDDGAKADYLAGLGERLKPGAPLLVFDYETMKLPETAYRQWLTAHGTSEVKTQAVIRRIATNWHPVADSRLHDLFQRGGFGEVAPVFQALSYRCWLAIRQ